MHTAIEDLRLDHLTIITPGERSYPLSEQVGIKTLKDTINNHYNFAVT